MLPALARAGQLDTLIVACAPQVHPVTMSKLIRVESSGNLYAVSDDGPANLPWSERKRMLRSFNPATKDEAVRIADHLRDAGHLFGLGPSQVSSRNLKPFGVTVEDALDLCTNLRIGSQILTAFYLKALKQYPDPNQAVLAAISAYNTGNYVDGFYNGYVRKVVMAGQSMVPALSNGYDSQLPQTLSFEPASTQLQANVHVRPPMLLSRKLAILEVTPE